MNHEGAEEEPQVHGAESGNGKPFFFLPEPSFLASSSEQARVEDASISNQVFQLHSVSTFKSAVLDGILRCVHLPGFLCERRKMFSERDTFQITWSIYLQNNDVHLFPNYWFVMGKEKEVKVFSLVLIHTVLDP